MSWMRNWCNFAVVSIALLSVAAARAGELPDYPCGAFGVEVGYISLDNLRRLRLLRQENTSSAAFLGLKTEDLPIIDEALRVGPSAGFFAARLLRDLVLIDAFEHQIQCDPKLACHKPDIIAGFSVDDDGSPGHSKTWQALIADWKEFRDKDASRSRTCLDVVRRLQTFDLPQTAMNDPGLGAQTNPHSREGAQTPAVAERVPIVAEPRRREQSDIDFACRKEASTLFAIRQIHFSPGKSTVRFADRKFLIEVAGSVASCSSLRIALVGHTDSDGPRKYNERLSLIRADAVAAILRKATAIKLQISGLGESHPAKPNNTRANKAQNRRVTIEVL